LLILSSDTINEDYARRSNAYAESPFLVYAHNCTYNQPVKIGFDPDKAAANPLNHEGVTFDEAHAVLLYPYALTRENGDADNEHRFITMGMGAKGEY
jgi:hypothetical protein